MQITKMEMDDLFRACIIYNNIKFCPGSKTILEQNNALTNIHLQEINNEMPSNVQCTFYTCKEREIPSIQSFAKMLAFKPFTFKFSTWT